MVGIGGCCRNKKSARAVKVIVKVSANLSPSDGAWRRGGKGRRARWFGLYRSLKPYGLLV